MKKPLHFCLLIAALLQVDASAAKPENLIRNGNFEGGMLYWHDQKGKEIVEGGKVGKYAYRMNEGYSFSAPMMLERDQTYTISLWAKTLEGKGRVNIGMPPMARETAASAKRVFSKEASKSTEIGPEWSRVSVSFKSDVKPTGFWPQPSYGVTVSGSKGSPILVDGVTVVKGNEGTADYIPRAEIEVVADPTNLPGYRGAAGNMYKKGATATLNGYVSNPGSKPQEIGVRWQLMDYEGVTAHADPVDTKIKLGAGETKVVPVSLPLSANGTVLARLTAFDSNGAKIDSSDMPLTSLPYEKAATKPNYEERFGGSFAGGVECLERMQRIGFGWTRWWANQKWHDYEPKQGQYEWSNDKFQQAFDLGISCHVVLYGWPEWIMDKNHPLPRDMRWKADDPKWDDLTVMTAWDRYVKAAVENFRGKSVVFQISNEPGHDKWMKDGNNLAAEYVKFNLRTARLIKQTDPKAQVSVNNVYLNPCPENGKLLDSKDLKNFDVWSWHDYRAGRLGDETTMKRMLSMLKGAQGEHLETWFTEGWAFTNTLVDQPPGPTHLTSLESTHAIMNSVAELTACGHDKMVLFHLMYGQHGMSFWDYSGPGVMIYDWYSYPTALVGGWNVLCHHIGLSEQIGFARPPGGNFCVFTDKRNDRGVMIAFADPNAKEDATINLPIAGLTAEDIQGNPVKWDGKKLTLSKTGRPVVLFTAKGGTGKHLLAALEPMDRKHLGFVSTGEGGTKIYKLPDVWEGTTKKSSEGNPAMSSGKPVWRVDHLFPNDAIMPGNYKPMVWGNQRWEAPDHQQGGHPSLELKNGVLRMGTMGPWSGEFNYKKQTALTFIVPDSGQYRIRFTAHSEPWGGTKADAFISVMKRDEQRVGEVKKFALKADKTRVDVDIEVDAARGHELVILAEMPNPNGSTNITLTDLTVTKK